MVTYWLCKPYLEQHLVEKVKAARHFLDLRGLKYIAIYILDK